MAQGWQEPGPGLRRTWSTYDQARGRVLVFGGVGGTGRAWSLVDGRWTPLAPPPVGFDAATAVTYDLVRGRVLLVAAGPATVTWEYDGASWSQVATANAPTAIVDHGMVFDLQRLRAVLLDAQGQTWEYDGVDWQLVPTATRPNVFFAAMAFDLFRGRTVLYGVAPDPLVPAGVPQTWEYDGIDWRLHNLPSVPSSRSARLTFDTVRGRAVLAGGVDSRVAGEAWAFDGTNWSQLSSLSPLPQTNGASLAYDALRDRTVLVTPWTSERAHYEFDGTNWQARLVGEWTNGGMLEYDRARRRVMLVGCSALPLPFQTLDREPELWRSIPTQSRPETRVQTAAAYDAQRRQLVVFGGFGMGAALANTWVFDGLDWRELAVPGPGPRYDHAMTYDAARRCVVLFGGVAAATRMADTWEFDGANWSRVMTAASPPARALPAMCWDAARGRTVMFGGQGYALGAYEDTWEFDGGTWVLAANGGPSPRAGAFLVYDPLRGRSVLTGGRPFQGDSLSDTWEWDGSVWNQAAPSMPEVRSFESATFDMDAGEAVVLGTRIDGALAVQWRRPAPSSATVQRYGPGCLGSAGVPTLDPAPGSVPARGSTIQLQLGGLTAQPGGAVLALGFDLVEAAGAPLPIDLGPAGMPGCAQWIALDAAFVVSHAGSAAVFALSIPNDPALDGFVFGAQALSLDPAAPGGLGALSNGLVLRIR